MLWFALVLAGATLPAAFGDLLATRIWDLRALAAGPAPWFVPAQAVLLYLLMPLAALSASLLLFLPGLLLALRLDAGRGDFGAVLLQAFAFSIAGLSLVLGLAEAAGGLSLTGPPFVLFLAGLSLAAMLPVWQADRHGGIAWDMLAERRADITAMAAVPVAVLLLLSAKFYWEAFNGDGAHLFLAGQNLIHTGSPFWDRSAGAFGGYPGTTTLLEVVPNAWFQRIFGPNELAARLPVLPGLAFLTGLVLDLIRYGRSDMARARSVTALAVGAALVLYAWVLAWNASYDPYFADIALPLSREPYVMIAFLGFVRFSLDRRPVWLAVYAAFSYIAIPSAPIFMVLWLLAMTVTARPPPWRWLAVALLVFVLVVTAGKLAPPLLIHLGIGNGQDEFNTGNLFERLRYVTPLNPQRMLFWILPCGILPVLALLAWRRQDPLSRALTLTTLGYFGFFYLQAYRILPHHFAPAMVLPLVVFWRLAPVQARPGRAAALALGFIALAAALSLPGSFRPHLYGRDFGATIAVDGAAPGMADDPALIAAAGDLLREAFPMVWAENAAERRYIGSPLAWYVHARQPKPEGQEIVYRLVPPGAAPLPAGWTPIAELRGYVFATADPARYDADRQHGGHKRSIGALYYVERNKVFGTGSRGWPRIVVDLAEVGKAFGLKGMTQ